MAQEAYKRQAAADPDLDPSWQIVKRWPKIRGEPKIAWRFLYLRSNRGREQIAVKAVDLGADQNTSDDAGNRYLDTLRREGLIECQQLGSGVKLITLLDPLDVAKARRACGGDSQILFGFLEELEEPSDTEYPPAVIGFAEGGAEREQSASLQHAAEPTPALKGAEPRCDPDNSAAVPPSEPRSDRGSTLGTAERADKDKDNPVCASLTKTKTETIKDSVYSRDQGAPRNRDGHRGSTLGTAERKAGGTATIGEALAGVIDGSVHQASIDRVAERIRRAVGDAGAEPVVIALAHAYADCRVKGPDLDLLLQRVASGYDAKGLPIVNRGGFFRRQVLFKFADLGIRPEDYLPRKPR
jgi:hypothetical protein